MIVKLLACDVAQDEIAHRLKQQFLIDLPAEEIARYHPASAPDLSSELATLFRATRAEYKTAERQAAAAETIFVKVATTSSFGDRSSLCIEKNGTALALFKTNDGFHAIDNTCTHRGGPLCEGTLDDGEVECPWHGARFNVTTGEATALPAPDDVERYAVRVRGEAIEAEIPPGAPQDAPG